MWVYIPCIYDPVMVCMSQVVAQWQYDVESHGFDSCLLRVLADAVATVIATRLLCYACYYCYAWIYISIVLLS